jgi:hypothetical protein
MYGEVEKMGRDHDHFYMILEFAWIKMYEGEF